MLDFRFYFNNLFYKQPVINSWMEYLNTFLALISKTEGRDKTLRLVQYATLHASQTDQTGTLFHIHKQIRSTRKVLRFLRTLEYSTKIRKQLPALKTQLKDPKMLAYHFLSIIQNIFGLLFFLSDHRVFLSELGVIDKSHREVHYPRSYKFYLLENIFGVLRNVIEIALIVSEGRHEGESLDKKAGTKLIKRKAFDLIKCLLDCLIALYYLFKMLPSKKIGILGVITSVMGILQNLNLC